MLCVNCIALFPFMKGITTSILYNTHLYKIHILIALFPFMKGITTLIFPMLPIKPSIDCTISVYEGNYDALKKMFTYIEDNILHYFRLWRELRLVKDISVDDLTDPIALFPFMKGITTRGLCIIIVLTVIHCTISVYEGNYDPFECHT